LSFSYGIEMSESARVLRFPDRRRPVALSVEEAQENARTYLSTPPSVRSDELRVALLSDPDSLLAVCSVLKNQREAIPAAVAAESSALYSWILSSGGKVGLFDEREYLLGETALQASIAYRLLGSFDEADLWLERSESNFRHIVNPAPQLTNVVYARLALKYARGRYDDVLELLPSLLASFKKLAMDREYCKARFLQALSLKSLARTPEALSLLEDLAGQAGIQADEAVHGQVWINVGDCQSLMANFNGSVHAYQRALPLVTRSGRPLLAAELKWTIGDTYRAQGNTAAAIEAYREVRDDYVRLEMKTYVAMLQLTLADSLLAADRSREAEWEILQALPTIEEQKMVPEGFAAVALLRESVKRKNADPNALRELREHLQKQN
jgi:tetratricopeptide (TPR) repeat protein